MPGSAAARSNYCANWSRAEPSGVATRQPSSPHQDSSRRPDRGHSGGPTSGLSIGFAGIEKRYGMRMALRGVSLEIGAGECVALVGHNGSGKTTLLKVTALLARPSKGQLTFSAGACILSSDDIKHRIGMVAHNTLVYDELTAEENLVFFAKLFSLPDPTERARQALEPVGLARRADDRVRTFSRGMRQRLAIARALLASPQLLLLDEPAAGLDPEGQQWLGGTLANLHAEGCTILMSTHGRNETQGSVTRAIRLEGGEVTHDSGPHGDPSGVLAMAAVRETAEGDAR
jgi:heme exporter protein A